MEDILGKFLESEERDGHMVDLNVWRNVTESGGKVALYCTTFASVLVDVLNIIRSMRPDQFSKHKTVFFPAICALVRVDSYNIRQVVQEILAIHVAPFVGVPMPMPKQRQASVSSIM